MGTYAPMIFDPIEPDPVKYDREYVVNGLGLELRIARNNDRQSQEAIGLFQLSAAHGG